jgi:hypothetical protein
MKCLPAFTGTSSAEGIATSAIRLRREGPAMGEDGAKTKK